MNPAPALQTSSQLRFDQRVCCLADQCLVRAWLMAEQFAETYVFGVAAGEAALRKQLKHQASTEGSPRRRKLAEVLLPWVKILTAVLNGLAERPRLQIGYGGSGYTLRSVQLLGLANVAVISQCDRGRLPDVTNVNSGDPGVADRRRVNSVIGELA